MIRQPSESLTFTVSNQCHGQPDLVVYGRARRWGSLESDGRGERTFDECGWRPAVRKWLALTTRAARVMARTPLPSSQLGKI